MRRIGIIGGGAAGMTAAYFAAEQPGTEVHLFEKNEKLGKKIFITGKGRCNFTNSCDPEELRSAVITNSRFLYSAFSAFDNRRAIALFEELGVKVKEERGGRMFPLSDHSSDIIRALERGLKARGVLVHLQTSVKKLLTEAAEDGENRIRGMLLADGTSFLCDRVIVATGGISYPSTGSTGDGYRFAEATGHRLKERYPALVPLETEETYVTDLQGLSLKNVTLTIPYGKKKKYQGFGEMMFTHFGVTGPLVLSASSCLTALLQEQKLQAFIDLKPALTEEKLDARILREFEAAKNKKAGNVIAGLFPAKLLSVMLQLSGIDGDLPVHEIRREERQRLVRMTKAFPFTVTGTRDFREAIITQGGVHVGDIRPGTMESRKVAGLYFAGEVLDLDAVTGGYNLQIAWSTGYLAGTSAAG